jgi:dipeptidyl aminopeptidase/acylaminoacyl peptidase
MVRRALHAISAPVAWSVLHPLRLPPLLTPRSVGLDYRSLWLESDGARLAAWHIPSPGSRAGVVLCHGHNDCRTQFLSLLRPLHEAGLDLLMFDFRAMGFSGGRHCTYGHREREDALTAVRYLREEMGVERVGLLGYSMGGATALLAAAHDPEVAAVVTDCAFARMEDMVEQRFAVLPPAVRSPIAASVRHWGVRWSGAVVEEVDPEAAVQGWRPRPLLVIHGERDRVIPPDHGRRLAAAGGTNAELWMVPNAPHVGCRRVARTEYHQRVAGFFQRHLLAE